MRFMNIDFNLHCILAFFFCLILNLIKARELEMNNDYYINNENMNKLDQNTPQCPSQHQKYLDNQKTIVIIKISNNQEMGNQLFKYAAGYCLAKNTNSSIVLIQDMFENEFRQTDKVQNRSIIDEFDIEYDQILNQCEADFAKTGSMIVNNRNILDIKGKQKTNMYLEGEFINQAVIDDCSQEIKRMLKSDSKLNKSKRYTNIKKTIIDPNYIGVAVYIRKGDINQFTEDYNKTPITFHIRAMQFVANHLYKRSKTQIPIFLLFSDDHLWVQNLFVNTANAYVISNQNTTIFQEFYLMAQCKHFIIPVSTYSWWPAFISDYPDKIVVSPKFDWPHQFNFDWYDEPQDRSAITGDQSLQRQPGWYTINQFVIYDSPEIIQRVDYETDSYLIENIDYSSKEETINEIQSDEYNLNEQPIDINYIENTQQAKDKVNKRKRPILIVSRVKKDGLGNQLFNYAAGYALATKLGYQVYLVDELLDLDRARSTDEKSRDYQLNQFDLQYTKIISEKQSSQFLRKGAVKVSANSFFNILDGRLKISNKNIFFLGYFLKTSYFKEYENDIKAMVRSDSKLNKSQNYLIWEKQIQDTMSVAVHVRIGDLVNFYQNENRAISLQYQIRAMQFIADKLKEFSKEYPIFYVFSDDHKFVRNSFHLQANVKIVSDGNLTSVEEFFLMIKCRHFIIPTTTFSWWAAFASNYQNKIVVTPEYDWPHQFNFKRFKQPQAYLNKPDKSSWRLMRQDDWYVINQFYISSQPPIKFKEYMARQIK
ncbi:glycosyl transferase family protein [Stylonychia lemnae]|uniref:Glycosyl transferase family protein n=1 Tax=Stylonychia lemnae TaxID=5949 RepID=A0A078A428_STYLE|nr:glycosyl transferase family protein [Stylonychia lemnae]|eukprot:CDW75519.1 glycosyl transferase family protein [Stylonychia lemnae]